MRWKVRDFYGTISLANALPFNFMRRVLVNGHFFFLLQLPLHCPWSNIAIACGRSCTGWRLGQVAVEAL